MKEPTRCPCGAVADGWPGDGDDELCQLCWERYCSDAWWRFHQQVTRLLHPETFPAGQEEADAAMPQEWHDARQFINDTLR